ncbi:MAG: phosphocholine cytidylyltransferase family protein [Oleibacter sp.]|nr:phosphocholine cytidylyltransferase family protein [Thalassolituus sp.]
MKAIILAAGIGSRIKPMTNDRPKCLLKVGGYTILERMISHITDCGISEVVFVLGYLQEQIKDYVKSTFPNLNSSFVINDKYAETNTGYSLMMSKNLVKGSSFVKFDADVVFDVAILKNLMASKFLNCLCIDKDMHLDAEEIKVIVDDQGRVFRASKLVNPNDAVGESIGIEKIDHRSAELLFQELENMMRDKSNHQAYYEAAYERLIGRGVIFYPLDIGKLRWVEIDTKDDFIKAEKIFHDQSL